MYKYVYNYVCISLYYYMYIHIHIHTYIHIYILEMAQGGGSINGLGWPEFYEEDDLYKTNSRCIALNC